jgi:hypothetical protein
MTDLKLGWQRVEGEKRASLLHRVMNRREFCC